MSKAGCLPRGTIIKKASQQDNVQLTHNDHKHSAIKFPLRILANDISDPLNIGSLFRLSDALGVEKLYLCGDSAVPPSAKIKKTSRSTEKYTAFESHPEAEILVASLKKDGVLIISLEITSSSVSVNSAEFELAIKQNRPVCLVLGAESSGINEALLSLSELTVHIPMYGNNSSMNVISAASIACFEITKNMKEDK